MNGMEQRRTTAMQRTLLTLAILAAMVGTAAAQNSSSVNTPSSTTPPAPAMGTGSSASTGTSTEAPNTANANGEQLSGAALTAKKAIERDGYRDVQGVAKGSDGLWHAQAMRGDTQVQVTVDRSGTVSAR
jgi:hypothetical protein